MRYILMQNRVKLRSSDSLQECIDAGKHMGACARHGWGIWDCQTQNWVEGFEPVNID